MIAAIKFILLVSFIIGLSGSDLRAAPEKIWSKGVRTEVMARLQLRAIRTVRLSENRGFLHEFPGDLWVLGDEANEYLDFEALSLLLLARGPLRVLRLLTHANENYLSASGSCDERKYNDVTPEALVSIWENELGLDLFQFDAILIGGCKSGLKKERTSRPTAKRMAVASKRPTFGAISLLWFRGRLQVYEISGDPTIYYILKFDVEARLQELGRSLPVEDPWDLFMPDEADFDSAKITELDALFARLNEFVPGQFSFTGEFKSKTPHPAVRPSQSYIEMCQRQILGVHTPLPRDIFPELPSSLSFDPKGGTEPLLGFGD